MQEIEKNDKKPSRFGKQLSKENSVVEKVEKVEKQEKIEKIEKVEKNERKGVINIPSKNILNNNPVISVKPIRDSSNKKRDNDNKEISDFVKKNDQKKKSNPIIFKSEKIEKVEKVDKIEKVEKVEKIEKVEKGEKKNQIFVNGGGKISIIDISSEISFDYPLKELMKKGNEVVLNGKDYNSFKKEENIKEIIKIKASPQPDLTDSSLNKEINIIEIEPEVKSAPVFKDKKQKEEFYDLNRVMNEMAKLEIDEDESVSDEQTLNYEKNIIETIDDERDINFIEDPTSIPSTYSVNPNTCSKVDFWSDNSQIEELRIELEKSLGFDLFKKIYKIIEEKVKYIR